tara:strand:- start:237 stop:533 length:297 start_codon:yes stop_codon:yes gene_type:complete
MLRSRSTTETHTKLCNALIEVMHEHSMSVESGVECLEEGLSGITMILTHLLGDMPHQVRVEILQKICEIVLVGAMKNAGTLGMVEIEDLAQTNEGNEK